MRKILQLVLALLLLVAAPAWGQIARVGGAIHPEGNSTTCAVTYTSTAGNDILFWTAIDNSTTTDVTGVVDSGLGSSSTWASRGTKLNGTRRISLWSARNVIANSTFTVTVGAAGSDLLCAVEEFSGVAALGNTNNASGTSTAPSVTLASTQDANNWFAVGVAQQGQVTFTASVGNLRQQINVNAQSTVTMGTGDNTAVSAGSAVTVTFTASASSAWAAFGLELRSTTGAAPAPPMLRRSVNIGWLTGNVGGGQRGIPGIQNRVGHRHVQRHLHDGWGEPLALSGANFQGALD